MRFFKYHGAGNDFIIIDNRESLIHEQDKSSLAQELCRRHFGVGGDGLIFVEGSEKADALMRIFNPDGSEAEMCGNGIRCMARYVYENIKQEEILSVETMAGIKSVVISLVDGEPLYCTIDMGLARDVLLDKTLQTAEGKLVYSFADTGVPHAVLFVDDIEDVDIMVLGPLVRHDKSFPKGTNVNFVEKQDGRSFKIRTFERGVEDETLACGTGITASAVVAVLKGFAKAGEEIGFNARGGKVYIRVVHEGVYVRAFMKGPAEFVFVGVVKEGISGGNGKRA